VIQIQQHYQLFLKIFNETSGSYFKCAISDSTSVSQVSTYNEIDTSNQQSALGSARKHKVSAIASILSSRHFPLILDVELNKNLWLSLQFYQILPQYGPSLSKG
jgi:hypothetical protein